MYKITFFEVKPDDIEPILKVQAGQGGFQEYLKKLSNQYSAQKEELYLDREDIEKLYRYTKKYGSGGFQNRISSLFEKIDSIIEDLLQHRQ